MLVPNIMKGRSWLAMVIAGKTFSEIAASEGVSKRRVQDVTNLALLRLRSLTASLPVSSPMVPLLTIWSRPASLLSGPNSVSISLCSETKHPETCKLVTSESLIETTA